MERRRMGMGVDWSELPQEIIESISKRLTIYIDYLRFRCVCRSWNSSVPKTPLHHLPPQLPWLMISHNSFFDLSTNKIHCLNLPMPSGPTRICGSSHGWLIILKETSELSLLNPITGATLSLSSLQTFPELVTRIFDYRHTNLYLIKVVLSSSPSLSDDFAAFAILNRSDFVFCKNGYDSWIPLNVTEGHTWIDAIYNKGLFYVTSMDGTIAMCDVGVPRVSFLKENSSNTADNDICYALFAGEDMFLFHRYATEEEEPQEPFEPYPDMLTVAFWIYKMNWNELKWEEIKTLGEHSVFIGKNSSLYFRAADFVGCRPNCVYFTDDVGGKHDFGIYSVSNKRIDPLPCYPHKSNCGFGYPVWVTPNP